MEGTRAQVGPERRPWLTAGAPALPPPRDKVITLHLDDAERLFLLVRLAQVGQVADALCGRALDGENFRLWTRGQVLSRTRQLAILLGKRPPKGLLIFGELTGAVLKEGIEGNPYFSRMPEGDPRFCVQAIRRAEALRRKMQLVLNIPITPMKMGERRGTSLDIARRGFTDEGAG